MEREHRHDIDALRGLAVCAVVLFHVHPGLCPGGFVGVTWFFVISGYLITLQLTKGASFVHFLASRMKRLLPARMALLLAVNLLFGGWVFAESANARLGIAKATFASVLSCSNLYETFFVESGYFAETSSTPLTHLWSLSLEEQFYLVWYLVFAYGLGGAIPKLRWKFLLSAMIVFVLFGQVLLQHNFHSPAYYLLPSRLAELLAGVCVAKWTTSSDKSLQNEHLAILGVALSVSCAFFYNSGMSFPGVMALIPSVGTAFLLAAGPNTRLGFFFPFSFSPKKIPIQSCSYPWQFSISLDWPYFILSLLGSFPCFDLLQGPEGSPAINTINFGSSLDHLLLVCYVIQVD